MLYLNKNEINKNKFYISMYLFWSKVRYDCIFVMFGGWWVGCVNARKSLVTESQWASVSLTISVSSHFPLFAARQMYFFIYSKNIICIKNNLILEVLLTIFQENMNPRFIEDDSDQSPYSLWSCIKRALRKKKCTCHLNNFGKVCFILLSLFFSFFHILQRPLQSKYIFDIWH